MNMPPPPPPGAPPPPPPIPPGGSFPGGPAVPGGAQLAEPWMRILARFLDAIVVGLVGGLIGAAIILSDGDSAGFAGFGGDASFGARFGIGLVGILLGFVYEGVLTKLYGGTPMKLAFGMKVVRVVDGGPVEWNHALLRWAVPGAFGLVPLLGSLASFVVFVVSLVFLFTDKLRQTVSDKVAKTMVVKAR